MEYSRTLWAGDRSGIGSIHFVSKSTDGRFGNLGPNAKAYGLRHPQRAPQLAHGGGYTLTPRQGSVPLLTSSFTQATY